MCNRQRIFVANFHSQGIFTARTIFFCNFTRKTIRIRQRIPSQRSIRTFLFEIWWLKFASEFSGRVSEFAFAFAAVSLRPPTVHSGVQSFPVFFLTFFRAPKKKGFSFFSCGATPSRTVPKTQPLEVAYSLHDRKVGQNNTH